MHPYAVKAASRHINTTLIAVLLCLFCSVTGYRHIFLGRIGVALVEQTNNEWNFY